MKNKYLTLILLLTSLFCENISARKTRSDKGKTHQHSTQYKLTHSSNNSNNNEQMNHSFDGKQILIISGISITIIGLITWYINDEIKRQKKRKSNINN